MSLQSVVTGRPMDPAVRKLMDAFATTPRGETITYAALEAIIGENRRTNRFKSVVMKWRKKMSDEHGKALDNLMNVGYTVCTATGQLNAAGSLMRQASRRVSKAVVYAERTPVEQLAEHDQRRRDHFLANAALIKQYAKQTASAVVCRLPERPSMPR